MKLPITASFLGIPRRTTMRFTAATTAALTVSLLVGCEKGPATAKAAAPTSSPAATSTSPSAPRSPVTPPSADSAPRPTVTSEFANLAKLMGEGLHEPFTELSFTVWHDKPLTSEKYETISRASLRVQEIAKQIPAFTRNRWTGEEIAFFENKALRLADLAGFLADAAKRQEQDHVVHYLMDLEMTCQKCHAEFAPDLKF